jgi:hypothetical protein
MSNQEIVKSETRRISTPYLLAMSKALEKTEEYQTEREFYESAIAEKCNKLGVAV